MGLPGARPLHFRHDLFDCRRCDGTFSPTQFQSLFPWNVGAADYDLDGFLDLYVANGDDFGTAKTANFLYHNNGNNLIAHFGLGDAPSATALRIEWPSGTVQELANVTVNQILTITEPRRPVLAVAVTATQLTGTIAGDPDRPYQIHVADDLTVGWTLLTTVTTDAAGAANWSDPGPIAQGRRFYKALGAP